MTEHQPRIAPPPGGGKGMFYDTPLDFEIEELARVAMRATQLDPLLTEVVRLRCAEYYHERLIGPGMVGSVDGHW